MPSYYRRKRNFGEVLSDALQFAGDNYLPYKRQQRFETRQADLDSERKIREGQALRRQEGLDEERRVLGRRRERTTASNRREDIARQDARYEVADARNIARDTANYNSNLSAEADRGEGLQLRERGMRLDEIIAGRKAADSQTQGRGFADLPSVVQGAAVKAIIEDRAIKTPKTGNLKTGISRGATSVQPAGFRQFISDTLPGLLFNGGEPTYDPANPARQSFSSESSPIDFPIQTQAAQAANTSFGKQLRQNAATGTGGNVNQGVITPDLEAYGISTYPSIWGGMTDDEKLEFITEDRAAGKL